MSDGRQGKYGATSGTYGAYCAAPGMAPTVANGAVAAALTSGWATRTVAAVFTVDVFTVVTGVSDWHRRSVCCDSANCDCPGATGSAGLLAREVATALLAGFY